MTWFVNSSTALSFAVAETAGYISRITLTRIVNTRCLAAVFHIRTHANASLSPSVPFSVECVRFYVTAEWQERGFSPTAGTWTSAFETCDAQPQPLSSRCRARAANVTAGKPPTNVPCRRQGKESSAGKVKAVSPDRRRVNRRWEKVREIVPRKGDNTKRFSAAEVGYGDVIAKTLASFSYTHTHTPVRRQTQKQ